MPKQIQTSREDVLRAALKVARIHGMDRVNARAIAKVLNTSVHPIFYHFENMEDLKIVLIKRIECLHNRYLKFGVQKAELPYKQIGINYLKFAKKEPKLFQILYMTPSNENINGYIEESITRKDKATKTIAEIIGKSTGFGSKKVRGFHIKMWLFTHGLATLLASGTIDITEEEISKLLTEQFRALKMYENIDKK